jgi:hypothetical protein
VATIPFRYTTGGEVYRPPGSWGRPHYSSLIPGLARDAAPLIPGLARDAGSGNEHSSLIPGLARDAGISKEGINVLSVNTLGFFLGFGGGLWLRTWWRTWW